MNTLSNYPPMPANADPAILNVSPAFKKSAANVTLSIVFFAVMYVLLITVAAAIALSFAGVGIWLVSLKAHWTTIGLCVGLLISCVMLLYFIIRFTFKTTKVDLSGMIEVTAEEQPELFAFIQQVTKEAKAPFPKHVYLTPEVNAGVFYDSTFLSMFFPVKKNLNIGLALVNSINLSEFKAVMAHEFGHFSQRSMKFGSYNYSVNNVIYNMLYRNDDYEGTMQQIGDMHWLVNIAVYFNLKVIKGIQWVLVELYGVVNRSYMGLSRQMEFHADAVSAFVAGNQHAINCLNRLQLGSVCYDSTLDFLNELTADKKRPANFYPLHTAVMQIFAADHHLPIDAAGVPIVNKKLPELTGPRIVIDDQWASHPSNEERERHLSTLNAAVETVDVSPWMLFRDREKLEQLMTNVLYQNAPERYKIIDDDATMQLFNAKRSTSSHDKAYKGFYNLRPLSVFDIDELLSKQGFDPLPDDLDDLLTDEVAYLPAKIQGMEHDVAMMDAIAQTYNIERFDFEGNKYTRSDIHSIGHHIADELEETRKELIAADERMFLYFYNRADDKSALADAYRQYFTDQQIYTDRLTELNAVLTAIGAMYNEGEVREIRLILADAEPLEDALKAKMSDTLANYPDRATAEQKDSLNEYIQNRLPYFVNGNYNDRAVAMLNKARAAYRTMWYAIYFAQKEQLLNMQLKSVLAIQNK